MFVRGKLEKAVGESREFGSDELGNFVYKKVHTFLSRYCVERGERGTSFAAHLLYVELSLES